MLSIALADAKNSGSNRGNFWQYGSAKIGASWLENNWGRVEALVVERNMNIVCIGPY